MRTALGIPAFRRLAVGYTLNELCDWMATVALAVLVYDQTGSALATATLFFSAKFLPSLFVPALAVRAERFPVGRCLAALYTVEAAAFVVLSIVARDPWVPLVCALAFVDGTIAATGRAVTRSATVAVLEPAGILRQGNAVLNLAFSSMSIAGPALAGFLVAGTSVPTLIEITAVVFAICAVVMGTSRGLPSGHVDETPWLVRLRAGAAYVAAHPIVRPLVLGEALLLVLFTMASPIEIVYAKESLGGGDATYGTLLTAWGAGVIIGSLLFARVHSRPLPVLIAGSTVIIGFAYVGHGGGSVARPRRRGGGARRHRQRHAMGRRRHGDPGGRARRHAGEGRRASSRRSPPPRPGSASCWEASSHRSSRRAWRSRRPASASWSWSSWAGRCGVLRRGTRDIVALRADHPLAAIDVPVAEVGTVAMAEVAAAPTMPHVP